MMQQQVEKAERLNQQIDFLNKENMKLEDQVKQMSIELKKSENMRTENRNQLSQINDLQFKLEQAKQGLMNTDFRVERVKDDLGTKHKQELQAAQAKNKQLEELLQ